MQRIIYLLFFSVLGCIQSKAQGDLLVTPTRVVFEGNKQRESLSLVNMGKEIATYSISFVQYNMKANGSFEIVAKPDSGQMFADTFLQVFPRKVTLAPGEPQVIMLQYRRKPDMLNGEYRSHLYFRSEKSNKPLGMGNSNNDSTLLSVQLIPIFGMSIPVIIRVGAMSVTASLSDFKLDIQEEATTTLKLTLNRTGNSSIYGNLSVEYFPTQGKSYEIGTVKGVGVYTNINQRNISIPLNKTPGLTLKNGKLKIRYTSSDDSKYEIYAEVELTLK